MYSQVVFDLLYLSLRHDAVNSRFFRNFENVPQNSEEI
jgi:hypothetical protein